MNGEDHDLIVRIDERVKTVYNKMAGFETMFTNHLAHHELWENDMKTQLRWGLGILATIVGGLIAAMRVIA